MLCTLNNGCFCDECSNKRLVTMFNMCFSFGDAVSSPGGRGTIATAAFVERGKPFVFVHRDGRNHKEFATLVGHMRKGERL